MKQFKFYVVMFLLIVLVVAAIAIALSWNFSKPQTETTQQNENTDQNKDTTVQTPTPTCVDPDGGLNYYVAGQASIPVDGPGYNPQFLDDWCKGNTLTEAYCSNGRVAAKDYICPNGCQNGACKQATACVPNWQCGWGECKDGIQKQVPVDSNNCGLPVAGSGIMCPALARACSNCPPINCIVDHCPGKHLPDANGCINCSSPCP